MLSDVILANRVSDSPALFRGALPCGLWDHRRWRNRQGVLIAGTVNLYQCSCLPRRPGHRQVDRTRVVQPWPSSRGPQPRTACRPATDGAPRRSPPGWRSPIRPGSIGIHRRSVAPRCVAPREGLLRCFRQVGTGDRKLDVPGPDRLIRARTQRARCRAGEVPVTDRAARDRPVSRGSPTGRPSELPCRHPSSWVESIHSSG